VNLFLSGFGGFISTIPHDPMPLTGKTLPRLFSSNPPNRCGFSALDLGGLDFLFLAVVGFEAPASSPPPPLFLTFTRDMLMTLPTGAPAF